MVIPKSIICRKCGKKIYIEDVCWNCKKKNIKRYMDSMDNKQKRL